MPNAAKLPDAEAIAEEYKNYAYIISHDLSAPLRSILGFSRLLEEEMPETLTGDAKLYLDMVMQSGNKMQQMMAGLLTFSRLNSLAKDFALVDMNAVLGECLADLQPAITARQAKIEAGALPNITADKAQMTQLLSILIDNAIKFTPPDQVPQIRISVQSGEQNGQHFILEDNGVGIAEKFRETVFQIFRRLHAENEYPGIGMGLALAKKIIARHGGEIWVTDSQLGGSAFHFTMI